MHSLIKFLILFACGSLTLNSSFAQILSNQNKIINEKNVHLIPRSEDDRDDEFADFKKNWKNKRLTFQGKINRAGGLSLDAYYINGCDAALRGMKLGALVSVTGNLVARESGGSGGEPINLIKCSIAESDTSSSQLTSATTQDTKIGYLAGTIKTFDGAGCSYYRASDDKKKNKKLIGADDAVGKGFVLNLDGRDVLFKGSNNSKGEFTGSFDTNTLRIPAAKSKGCGEECSKTLTSFNLNLSGTVTQTPVVGYCGS